MDKKKIALAYDALPTFGPDRDLMAFRELGRVPTQCAILLRRHLNIVEVKSPEPYENAQDMFNHIQDGMFHVSDVNHTHPMWTPEQNVDFRIFHDVLGHYAAKADFSWSGELVAMRAGRGWLNHMSYRALFTEIAGQTAWYSVHGEFPEQKAALLPEKLMDGG